MVKGACYAASRGQCNGPKAAPPCKRRSNEPPKKLTPEQDLTRDRWEESILSSANAFLAPDPQLRLPQQKKNAAEYKGNPRGKGKGKGEKGRKGDPDARPCWNWQRVNAWDWSGNCRFRKNTPGNP